MSNKTMVVDADSIRQSYLSKRAKGTQIMAGSLKMLGGLDVSSLKTGEIDAGSAQIKTTGRIDAGAFHGNFNGNGANITNLSSAAMPDVVKLDGSRTMTGELKIDGSGQLLSLTGINKDLSFRMGHNNTDFGYDFKYLGTENATQNGFEFHTDGNRSGAAGDKDPKRIYRVAQDGEMHFDQHMHISGEKSLNFKASGVGGPGTAGEKINFLSGRYTMGVESNTLWYNSNKIHMFYTGGSKKSAAIDDTGITSETDMTVKKNLHVYGEFVAAGSNRFPDPYVVDESKHRWYRGDFDRTQKPFEEANGSIKTTAIGDAYYNIYLDPFETTPGAETTFSSYVMSTTASKQSHIRIEYRNAENVVVRNETHSFIAPTRWERFSVTGTAPSNATNFRVRVDNYGGSGTIMYFSGFQVETGKTLTNLRPFGGTGNTTSFATRGLVLGRGKSILSNYNNESIVRDHNSGSVSLSAAGANLHLGYENTTRVLLNTDLHGSSNGQRVIDTAGRLYYQGTNIENIFFKQSGGDISGRLSASGDIMTTGKIVAKDGLFVSYQGTSAERYKFEYNGSSGNLELHSYTSGNEWVKRIDFPHRSNGGDMLISGNRVWHAGNDGASSGLDADRLDGSHASAFATIAGGNTFNGHNSFSSTNSAGNYGNSGIEMREVNRVGTGQSSAAYAPAIAFHWMNRTQGQLALESNGVFTLRDGASHAVNRTLNAGNLQVKGADVWHADNDGAGSGLDADLLDGKHHTEFLATNPTTQVVNVNSLTLGTKLYTGSTGNWTNRPPSANNAGALLSMNTHGGTHYSQLWFDSGGNDFYHRGYSSSINNWSKVWTESNDGAGSGLDADTVDGIQGSRILLTDQGNTVTEDFRVYKKNAWMTIESTNSGGVDTDQGAGISIGESGRKGSAALHLTYTGNGHGHIGMGSVSASTGRPSYQAMELHYQRRSVKFFDTPDVNGNSIWHEGNDGAGSGLDADTVDGLNAASFLRSNANTTMSQTLTVSGKINLTGDMDIAKPIYMASLPGGNHREGGKLNTLSRIAGRIANKNPDFMSGTLDGYRIYDNNSSNRVQLSIVTDNMTPSATGKIMRISYDPSRSTTAAGPGYGGFANNTIRGTGHPTDWAYRGGNRYIHRVVAKIPSGRDMQFASNSVGTGAGIKWISDQGGTGDWQEYLVLQTIGNSGTMSSTGFFYVNGGANSAFTWDVSIYQMIGVDEVPDVDRAPSLNVGYKQGELGWGQVHATGDIITDANLEVKGDLFLTGNNRDWAFRAQGEHFSLVESDDSNREHIRINDGGDFDLKPNGITAISMDNAGNTNIKRTLRAESTTELNGVVNVNGKMNVSGGSTFSGSNVFNTNLNVDPIIISRNDRTNEAIHIGVTDNDAYIEYKNDEASSTIHNRISDTLGSREWMTTRSNSSGLFTGINKTAPTEALDVNGNIQVSGNLLMNEGIIAISNISSGNIDHIWHSDNGTGSHETVGTFHFVSDASAKANGNAGIRAGSIYMAGGNNYMAGRLGIGRTNPSQALDVSGNIISSNNIVASNNVATEGGYMEVRQPSSTGNWSRGYDFTTASGTTRHGSLGMFGSGTSAQRMYWAWGTSPYSSNNGMHMLPNGNVGFGSTSPRDTIEVNRTNASSVLTGTNAYGGIHLSPSSTNDSFTGITSSSSSNGTQAGILFQSSRSYGTKMHFMTTNSFANGMQQQMTLDNQGRLGIGKNNPSHPLDVVGKIASGSLDTGSISASFIDTTNDISINGVNGGIKFIAGGEIYQTTASDNWIRSTTNFYAPSGIIRSDNSLQVGSNGSNFLANSSTFSVRGSSIYTNAQGRVSINDTSTNEHPLHVRSTQSYSGLNIKTQTNSATNGISFQNTGDAYTWHIARDGSQGNDPDLVFYGSNYNYNLSGLPERIRFTTAGRLGVGISNPSEMIHTSGNVQGTELVMGHPDSNQRRASWRYDNSHTFGGSAWAYIFKDDQNNRERIYIQQTANALANMSFNANVSIGSTNVNPTSPLYVQHNGSDGHITINRSSGFVGSWTMGMPNGAFSISNNTTSTTAGSLLHIQTNGNVGIGMAAETTAAKSKLHVAGRTESNDGFKTGNFEIIHNSTEDSLDFVFTG